MVPPEEHLIPAHRTHQPSSDSSTRVRRQEDTAIAYSDSSLPALPLSHQAHVRYVPSRSIRQVQLRRDVEHYYHLRAQCNFIGNPPVRVFVFATFLGLRRQRSFLFQIQLMFLNSVKS